MRNPDFAEVSSFYDWEVLWIITFKRDLINGCQFSSLLRSKHPKFDRIIVGGFDLISCWCKQFLRIKKVVDLYNNVYYISIT